MSTQAINKYKDAMIDQASPVIKVAMVLEKAANLMDQAIIAHHEGRIEDRFTYSVKAIDLLGSLTAILVVVDEATAAIANDLTQYYAFLIQRINLFNVDADPAIAERVSESLREMAGTWRQIAAQHVEPTV
jgi:flagellar biosynthetic protein FliS